MPPAKASSTQTLNLLQQLGERLLQNIIQAVISQVKNPAEYRQKKEQQELARKKRQALLDTEEVKTHSIAFDLEQLPEQLGESQVTHTQLQLQQATTLEKHLPAVASSFADQLKQNFAALEAETQRERRDGEIGVKSFDFEHLTLLDDEELSFQIIINQFTSFEHQHYSTPLTLLCMRFEKLCRHGIEIADLPLSPDKLADSIKVAISALELESKDRIALFSALLAELNDHYGQLVQAANNMFIRHGVLPDLNESDGEARYKRSQERIRIQKQRKALLESLGKHAAEDENAPTPKMGEVLERLEIPESVSEHHLASSSEADGISPEALLQRIEWLELGKGIAASNGYLSHANDQATLAKQLEQQARNGQFTIGRKAANIISMISMLFDDLFQNRNISTPIRALLAKLQGPLLKAALRDEEFFADTDNPAQNFLNMIAEQGAGWSPDKDPQKDALYHFMVKTIDSICANFDSSYSTFEDAIDAFEDFLIRDRQRINRIEERIVAAEKAQARLARAKQVADDHIALVFDQFLLPQTLSDFIYGSWKQVLFYIYNTFDSKNNEEWQAAMNAELHLLNTLQGNSKHDIRDIARALGKQMLLAGQEKNDVNIQLRKALPFFKQTPTRDEPNQDVAATPSQTTQNTDDALSAETESAFTLKQLEDNVAVGTWFRFSKDDQEEKIKVAAVIKHTDTYILVHRNGTKFGGFSSSEMLSMINQQQLTILENSFMFDRALESVIGNIRH